MSDTIQSPVDTSFAGLVDALVELIRSGVRPDVLEAQRVLLQRLSTQGDVFPARIPAPRNITEVGGYLNLLERAGHIDLRSSALAGALGIAGPAMGGEVLAGVVPSMRPTTGRQGRARRRSRRCCAYAPTSTRR